MPATLAASFSAWRYEAKWPEAGAQARAAAQGVRQVGPRVSDTETAFPLNQSRGMRAAASNLLRRVPTRCCPRCGDPAARPPGRLPPASPRHAALGQVCAVGVCVARTCKCCLVCASCRVVCTRLRARRGGDRSTSAVGLALGAAHGRSKRQLGLCCRAKHEGHVTWRERTQKSTARVPVPAPARTRCRARHRPAEHATGGVGRVRMR